VDLGQVLPATEDDDVGAVHNDDEEPDIPGGVGVNVTP
jgi:hypothetical protein